MFTTRQSTSRKLRDVLLLAVFLSVVPLAVLAVQEEATTIGMVTEVRDASFDLRTHDSGTKTFSIPAAIDADSGAAIRTGNRVQVVYSPGASVTSFGRLIGVAEAPAETDPAADSAETEPIAAPVPQSATDTSTDELDAEPVTLEEAQSATPQELPKTASSLPLLPLFGLLALLAAAATGVVIRNS